MLEYKIAILPELLREKILKKHRWQDRQLTAAGKLLLWKIIKNNGSEHLLNNDLNYDQYNRPFVNADFDFNISHSGEIAGCAASFLNKVGFDLEKIKDIDISGFHRQFTESEWAAIIESENIIDQFYRHWTRKEALAKVIGTGLNTEFNTLNVEMDEIFYRGTKYFLSDISLAQGYKACVVTSNARENITITQCFI